MLAGLLHFVLTGKSSSSPPGNRRAQIVEISGVNVLDRSPFPRHNWNWQYMPVYRAIPARGSLAETEASQRLGADTIH
jgi:hypothetical protein